MKNIVLEAKNLSFEYPGDEDTKPVSALRDVSFAIEEGSFTAILGHNGSGKSTLAKLLCMIYQPTAGQIFLGGRDMTAEGITEKDIMDARREIGMVFQNPDNQIVATVVEEDVAFGCENLGIPSAEIRRRVDEALEIVGMRKYARHAPHKLSGGQKQRVAIARIFLKNPPILILDEATSALDSVTEAKIQRAFDNLAVGRTTLIIAHRLSTIRNASRIVSIADGIITECGTHEELVETGGVYSQLYKTQNALALEAMK